MSEKNHEMKDGNLTEMLQNPIKETMGAIVKSVFIALHQAFSKVREVLVDSTYGQLQKTLQSFVKILRELLDPDISDEEIQQKISSYQTWGEYGWVIPPEAPFGLFDNPPCDRKDANRIAMRYCKAADIDDIFARLATQKHVRKSDLQEAKFCFDNKKYKACVMMLFSMIDARLIRLSSIAEKERQRPSGSTAATRLIDHIKQEYDDAKYLFIVLHLTGLRACYECIFARGNDFKKQVPSINRNFVDHGMRWKKVTRTECIQVLLLYQETIRILDFLNVRRMPTSSRCKQK